MDVPQIQSEHFDTHPLMEVRFPDKFRVIEADSSELTITVPETNLVLEPTSNVGIAQTLTTDEGIAIRIPRESVALSNYSLDIRAASDEVRRQDPVYKFAGYIEEFVGANPDFSTFLENKGLPARAAFVTDPSRSDRLICIFPSK